jgi:two-component system response regulator AtoC
VKYRILVIDDNRLDLDVTVLEFRNEADMEFTKTQSAAEAIDLVRKNPDAFAVILLDFRMPDNTGDKVAKDLLAINARLNIVMLSGDTTQATAVLTMRAGAADFIDKSLPSEEKIAIVRSYCKKWDEVGRVIQSEPDESERARLIKDAGLVTGRSKQMADIAKKVLLIRDSHSTVLIRGESGTGKELVARAVHQNSARRNHPFIAINCGAIPEGLIESELFGHEKGAFTNAVNRKIGKFQLAHNGTIFLDEVGEMPLNMQVKLLRVLQEGTIDPVGARASIDVNVRVIAATNRNLEEAVEKGEFREDLYYRLNVIPLFVAPLRERKEDITPLITYFVQNHPTGFGKKILYSTLNYFLDYSWKGNVRELENTIDRLLTLTPDEYIYPRHLEPKFFGSHSMGIDFDCDWKTFLEQRRTREDELERKFLSYHLTRSKSVRDLAVSTLKMPKSTLQARIEDLDIEVKDLLKGREEYADAAT